MHTEAQSKAYHKIKIYLFFLGLILDIAILIFVVFSGLSVQIREFSIQLTSNFFLVNGIYITLLGGGMYLIHFPLSVFEGFFWEHKFHLSNQKFNQWLVDELKKLGLSYVFMLIVVETIYVFLNRFPPNWWVGAGIFWLFLTLVLARIMPNVIIPMFYKYSNIENAELRERILTLFKECKVNIQNAYMINFSSKTKKATAFICGLGKTRRVVLTDTLVSNFTIPEIETVVAHELGHYKHRDILKINLINSLVIFFGFYLMDRILRLALVHLGLTRIDDIAFFPILALGMIVFGFLTTPLMNWYSRIVEVRADRFSLELTQKPKEFIAMMHKLATMNLAEYEPNRFQEVWFYDHPPIAKRIKFAENFN